LLERIGHFTSHELTLVGGGSRNDLWNQIKADLLNLPVKVVNEAETTVLGASMFVWSGIGYYATPQAARQQVDYQYQWFRPGDQAARYQQLLSSDGVISRQGVYPC
jgi:L-fuculokinase